MQTRDRKAEHVTFGRWLRDQRKAMGDGWTQEKLAQSLNPPMTRQQYQRIEGGWPTKAETVEQLIAVMNLDRAEAIRRWHGLVQDGLDVPTAFTHYMDLPVDVREIVNDMIEALYAKHRRPATDERCQHYELRRNEGSPSRSGPVW